MSWVTFGDKTRSLLLVLCGRAEGMEYACEEHGEGFVAGWIVEEVLHCPLQQHLSPPEPLACGMVWHEEIVHLEPFSSPG